MSDRTFTLLRAIFATLGQIGCVVLATVSSPEPWRGTVFFALCAVCGFRTGQTDG